ncbi:MAG TPA: HAD family phosphatase [Burkholderiaceae bacterium]|nr:HAD family phosphatase [Burkholderiaceae bacterium]
MAAIDTVVFDIGNVLIPWNARWLFRKLLPDDAAVDRFMDEVDFVSWNRAHDAGQPFAEGIARHGAAFPHYRPLFEAFFERWVETIGEPIEGSVALARRLRTSGYRTLALTNFSAETFPRALQRHPFLAEFEGIVVSGHEGLMKPEPAIYRRLCERYRVDPARAVFIDDASANVEGARAIGMHGVQFESPAQLVLDLRALGVAA